MKPIWLVDISTQENSFNGQYDNWGNVLDSWLAYGWKKSTLTCINQLMWKPSLSRVWEIAGLAMQEAPATLLFPFLPLAAWPWLLLTLGGKTRLEEWEETGRFCIMLLFAVPATAKTDYSVSKFKSTCFRASLPVVHHLSTPHLLLR